VHGARLLIHKKRRIKATDTHETKRIKRAFVAAEFITAEQLSCGGINAIHVPSASSSMVVSERGVEIEVN